MSLNQYHLVGLPEGLLGKSHIHAKNIKDLFKKYPVLNKYKKKLTIKSRSLVGVVPCDG